MNKVMPVNFPDEDIHEVRQYTKKELCTLYNISKNTLAAWINRSAEKFEAIGYIKRQRILTKAQIQLCFDLWGEP